MFSTILGQARLTGKLLLRGQPCLEGCDDVVDERLALRMVDPEPLPHRVVHVNSNEDFWPCRDIPVGGHQQIRSQDADFRKVWPFKNSCLSCGLVDRLL